MCEKNNMSEERKWLVKIYFNLELSTYTAISRPEIVENTGLVFYNFKDLEKKLCFGFCSFIEISEI